MDVWIRLNSSTAGKDKLIRLLQYLSRFVWYHLERRKNLRDAVARLKILESSFSTFRKLMRLDKSVTVLHGALRTLHLPDRVLRATLTLSRIYQALFLAVDHVIWVGRVGLWDVDKAKWSNYSDRFWLGSIVLNLLRDAYEVSRILRRQARCRDPLPCPFGDVPVTRALCEGLPPARPLLRFAEEHADVFWDCLKNLCDVWIPLSNLGHARLSPGTVGLLGSVSSLAGLVAVLDPLAKLVPA